MKISPYSIAAGAIALSASTMAGPTLYKRVTAGLHVGVEIVSCLARGAQSGEWPAGCGEAASKDFGILKSLQLNELTIDFRAGTNLEVGVSSNSLTGNLVRVGNYDWPVSAIAPRASLWDNGNELCSFEGPSMAATVKGGVLSSELGSCLLKIHEGQEDNFSAFIAAMITNREHTFGVSGWADADLITAGRTFKAPSVAFSSELTLKTLDNLPILEHMGVESVTKDAATGEFTIGTWVNVHNPSQVAIKCGDVSLNAVDKAGAKIGLTLLKDLTLGLGDNKAFAVTTSTDAKLWADLTTSDYTLLLRGHEGSSKTPILAKALIDLKLQIHLSQVNV